MKDMLSARQIAVTLAGLLATFGALAQTATARVDVAQNGGAVESNTAPRYHAGLGGRVKQEESKSRSQGAQNGGNAAAAGFAQPKYNAALGGRPAMSVAQSDAPKTGKTPE